MKILILFVSVMLITACHRHYQPLNAAKKAKLVSELIIATPQCTYLKKRLLSPTMNDDEIDHVYHDALKAQCMNKDV